MRHEEHEKPYHPSQLTRFRQRIGPERLKSIMEHILARLKDAGTVKGEIVVCDATFIKAVIGALRLWINPPKSLLPRFTLAWFYDGVSLLV
jgi:hypothetical protein